MFSNNHPPDENYQGKSTHQENHFSLSYRQPIYYFISDLHWGIPNAGHQTKLLDFFKILKNQARNQYLDINLFLLGDLFEFWTTLALVAHKNILSNNIMAKEINSLKAVGIKIYFLPGNHDYWLKPVFSQQGQLEVLDNFQILSFDGKNVLIGHGEEINQSFFSRLTLKIYRSKILKLIFYLIGSELAMIMSKLLSNLSSRLRFQTGLEDKFFQFVQNKILKERVDIVILGHTHKPRLEKIENGYYLNTGDWIHNFSYGMLSQGEISLKRFI